MSHATPEARPTLLITGGTGFIGQAVIQSALAQGYTVMVLSRRPASAHKIPNADRITWCHRLDDLPQDTLVHAVINLAGEPIANGLWTQSKRAAIRDSRLRTTAAVVALIDRLTIKPAVLISGSAIGFYGVRGHEALHEDDAGVACFSHDLCRDWEAEAQRACLYGVRVVLMRTGLVLDAHGGLLARMLLPFSLGLGGRFGSGKQGMSWIHRADWVRLMFHALETPSIDGPLNATAPYPVSNADFTLALAAALKRPAFFHVPEAVLRLLGGDLAKELLLGGQFVYPHKALAHGFAPRYPRLELALDHILNEAHE